MADETEQGDQSAATTTKEAKEVVDSWLGLTSDDGFITRHLDHILNKLEEAHEIAGSRKNADMVFFAESFPTIDGLIQVGTTSKEYQQAINKMVEHERSVGVNQDLTPADEREQAEHLISAHVFYYVARLGAINAGVTEPAEGEKNILEPKTKRLPKNWKPIWQRVLKLTGNE